jgi:STE24 endopeptidase
MNLYSVLFAAMLLLAVSLQLHLARRQRRHIETHRDQVPKQFAGHVTLAEHRKAADYSLAKLQLEKVSLLTGALVLLVWLFGGMAEIVLAAWSGAVSSPLPSSRSC